MEKRLFLAVGLSLLVVFVFQSFFSPKTPRTSQSPATATISDISKSEPSDLQASLAKTGLAKTSLPEKYDFKQEIFKQSAGAYSFEVSNNGASINSVYLNDFAYKFPVHNIADLRFFEGKKFSFLSGDRDSFSFGYNDKSLNVIKDLSVAKYKILVKYKITNISNVSQNIELATIPFNIDLSRLDNDVLKSDWTLFEYAFKTENKIERKEQVNNFNEKWNKEELKNTAWLAFRDRYFVTLVEPKTPFKGFATKPNGDKKLEFTASSPSVTILPGKTAEYSFTIYCGPQKLDLLKAANPGFEKVMVFSSWGWLDFIAKGIYWILGAVHKVLPVWGLCIIFVSLFVYGCMYPLTLKSMMSMKKMQALQPKMTQLKEKYKDNAEKLNKEIVELYKVNNVNPVSGCLPMLLQMPIFVGLYQVLWRSVYFRGESFLWIKDLSMPDRLFKLPVTIPFLGEYLNILPILMMGIMLLQQIITMKASAGGDPEQVQQQKMMAIFMPVMLGVMFYNFASGLNLYFVVFYSLSALSQWNISRDTKATT